MKWALIFFFLVQACAAAPIDDWQTNMVAYGTQHCNTLKAAKASGAYNDDILNGSYYDGERVYYQIGAFTGDNRWDDCAQASEWVYRDRYIASVGGQVAGYWNFARGLAIDVQRTNDPISRSVVVGLGDDAPWCRGNQYEIEHLPSAEFSRENAYCVMTFVELSKLGYATPRLAQYKEFAKGHVNQWTSRSYPLQPFMGALTAEALITYYDNVALDISILPLIYNLEVALWQKWDPASKSFLYDNHDGTFSPAPDLNLLIAPVFAWYYARTGDTWSRDRFDEVFAGGVSGAYLAGSGKQFNQNYRWSIQAVAWRNAVNGVTPTPLPSPVATATPTRTPTKTPTALPSRTPTQGPTRTATPCSSAVSLAGHECRIKRLEGK